MAQQFPPTTFISYFDGRTLEYIAIEGNESKRYTAELLSPQPLVTPRGRTGYFFPPPTPKEVMRWNHNRPYDYYGPQGRGLLASNSYEHGSQGSLGSDLSMAYDEQGRLYYPSQPNYNYGTSSGASGIVDPLLHQNQWNHNGYQNQGQSHFERDRNRMSGLESYRLEEFHKNGTGSNGKYSAGNHLSGYADRGNNEDVPHQIPVAPQQRPKISEKRGNYIYTKETTEPQKPMSSPPSNTLRTTKSKNGVSLPVPGSPTESIPGAGNQKQAQKSALNSPHLPLSPKKEDHREKHEAYIPGSGLPPNEGPEIPEKKVKEEESRP